MQQSKVIVSNYYLIFQKNYVSRAPGFCCRGDGVARGEGLAKREVYREVYDGDRVRRG